MPTLPVEQVSLTDVKPHPRNYRDHQEDQVEHIKASITENGVYKNIVIANEGTVLAGHGMTQACLELGVETVNAVRLPWGPDDPRSLKVLVGDNLISSGAMDDDRALTNILKELADEGDLLGTGLDEGQLAALLMATRPSTEIESFDAAAEGVGMPEYEPGQEKLRLIISFETGEDRERFVSETGLRIDKAGDSRTAWSTRWPWTDRHDLASLKFQSQ